MADAQGTALRHAVRLVPTAYLVAILIGAIVLSLPICRTGVGSASPGLAGLFTAVSGICVTGLATVDIATYYSGVGHVVIVLLISLGGLGIMTLASLLALLVRGRIRLQDTLVAQTDSHAINVGDVRRVVTRVVLLIVSIELVIALALGLRFVLGYGYGVTRGLWHGLFHSVTAVNNVGYSLNSDNIMSFVGDAWICFPICAGIIAGGLGYPVYFELRRAWRRPSTWSVHTRLTVYGTVVLLAIGIVGFALFEWTNTRTLGPMDGWTKAVASVTGGVVPRTGGYNSIDYANATAETKVMYAALMFIGGGSAGIAGGIKVTTFFVLAFVIWAEVRGEPDVTIAHRSIPARTQRQALTVALLAVGAVVSGTIALVILTDNALEDLVFEAISAFSTVGLTTGVTPTLPPAGQAVDMILMFIGRVGTVTALSALAIRNRRRHFRLPEETPLVG